MTQGSLGGIRVLDVTANVAGPFTSRILAELGADVIKVERPGTGDDTRSWGPPSWHDVSLTFADLNRGKRSLVADLQSAEGLARVRGLVADADVLIQNLRPGTLERLGLGPAALLSANPRLVYCEITGFGAVGPDAGRPAFDPLIQAFSGLMSITGEAGRPPVRIPVSILDRTAGLWSVIGILDALRSRERTGKGGTVRTSLLEAAIAWEAVQVMGHLLSGDIPERLGSGQVGIGSYGAFATADGHVLIAAGNDRLWARTCQALGEPGLASDLRFSTNADRVANREALTVELERMLGGYSTVDAIAALGGAGVPVGPVNNISEALREPQVEALAMLTPLMSAGDDHLRGVRLPVTVSNGARGEDRPPPRLGQHSAEGFSV